MATQLPIPENDHAITAGWMQQALTAGGKSDLPAIRQVAVEDVGQGFGMVGKILRCHLTYHHSAPGAPASVILKLPGSHPETLRAARTLRLYQREYTYYRQVAAHVPIRSPALLYGNFDDTSHRFVLALEDLRSMTAVDQIDGASIAQAQTAIRSVAQIHGLFWDNVNQPPVSDFCDSANPARRPLVQSLYQASLASALNRFGHIFPAPMRRLAAEYGPQVAAHLGDLAAGPQTFIHGDFRLDNMFFSDADPESFAVIDWQLCGIASGLYDVAYFLSSSVASDVRREIERDLLTEYHRIVRASGVADFTLEDCWRSYRQNMLSCFRTPIIAGGQLDFTSHRSRQLAEVFLQRTLTAIDDLDAVEFLPGRPLPS